jgi:Subtilase family
MNATMVGVALVCASVVSANSIKHAAFASGVLTQTEQEQAALCSQSPLPGPDWILKTYGGPEPVNIGSQFGINEPVRLVIVDEGPPRLLGAFGPVTVIPESTKVATDLTHVRTMLGLAAAKSQGIAATPGIEVQAVTVHSVSDRGAYKRAIAGIVNRAGVTSTGGVRGPSQRVLVALPVGFGGLLKTPDVRKLLKAGVQSGRILWFGAGGNPGDSEVPAPGSYDEVIGVAAATAAGAPVAGVPSGSALDLGAAGDCQITPNDAGGFSLTNGSSGASVVAASLGARVWVTNPTMHGAQVRQILESATTQKTKTDQLGWGVSDLDLIPPDTVAPVIKFRELGGNRVEVSVTDVASPQAPFFPQSGVAVGIRRNAGAAPSLVLGSRSSPAAFSRATDPCRQYCENLIVEPGEQITVTAIDSPTYASLSGWTGQTATELGKTFPFSTATFTNSQAKLVPKKASKTKTVKSSGAGATIKLNPTPTPNEVGVFTSSPEENKRLLIEKWGFPTWWPTGVGHLESVHDQRRKKVRVTYTEMLSDVPVTVDELAARFTPPAALSRKETYVKENGSTIVWTSNGVLSTGSFDFSQLKVSVSQNPQNRPNPGKYRVEYEYQDYVNRTDLFVPTPVGQTIATSLLVPPGPAYEVFLFATIDDSVQPALQSFSYNVTVDAPSIGEAAIAPLLKVPSGYQLTNLEYNDADPTYKENLRILIAVNLQQQREYTLSVPYPGSRTDKGIARIQVGISEYFTVEEVKRLQRRIEFADYKNSGGKVVELKPKP